MKSKQKDLVGRVLSVRIPNSLLLGCYDVCELYGLHCSTSLSSSILETLRQSIEEKQSSGLIPVYESDVDAGALLEEKSQTGFAWTGRVKEVSTFQKSTFQKSTYQKPVFKSSQLVKEFNFPKVKQEVKQEVKDLKDDNFAPDLYDLSTEFSSGETFDTTPEFGLNISIETPPTVDEFDFYNDDEQALFEQLMGDEISKIQQQEQDELLSKILVKKIEKRPAVTALGLINTSHNVSVRLHPVDSLLLNDRFYKNAQDELTQKAIRLVYDALPDSEWSTEKASLLIEKTILSLISLTQKTANEP